MENREKLQDIELRSEEVQEILSRPPNKILWIGYLIFIFALITIGLSYRNFQSKADTYELTIQVTKPSQIVTAPFDATIKDIYVNNNQYVTVGQKIMSLDTVTIKSNIEGKINFQNFIIKDQIIKKNEQILTIQPKEQFIEKGAIFIDKEFKSSLNNNNNNNKVITLYVVENKSLFFKGIVNSISDLPNSKGLYYTELIFNHCKVENNIVKNNKVTVEVDK